MDQIQEYHSKFNLNFFNFFQIGQITNCFFYIGQSHENAYIDPQLLQLNSTFNSAGKNYSYYSSNASEDFSEISCADCLTIYSPTWRIRQDGKKVCNACGL